MSVTDEIKTRLDAVEVIGQYVPLSKSGRNYKGLCPFHTEKTPSFFVFPDSGSWRCFGACSEGGDIFNFVMKAEGMDFVAALRHLADMAGVELEPQTPQQKEAEERKDRLRRLMAEATLFFNNHLLNSPDGETARHYVNQRGLSADIIREWQIGYAPPGWENTLHHLQNLSFSGEDIIEAGMVVVKDDGGIYDRFRDRLIIPIFDPQGNVVGFGARGLEKDATPKYINSPQGELFDKSHLLYGFSHARRSIRETETVVIVEGYMDVLQAHQAGYTNVVAQMGTALTEHQLKLLSRYASRLILALDPDAAGQMATDRGREVIERVSKAAAEQAADEGMWGLDTAENEYRARVTAEFDPQGMIRYESRMGFDIRVVVLPDGHDPDDLIREYPEHWENLIDDALPIVEYVIQTEIQDQNLDDPKIKSRVADRVVPLIQDIANPVERSHYRQRLARLLKVDELALFPERDAGTARRPQRSLQPPPQQIADAPAASTPISTSPTQSGETFCLAALIQHPRLLYQINRILAEYLDPEKLMIHVLPDDMQESLTVSYQSLSQSIMPTDFSQVEHQIIFEVWQVALEQDEENPSSYLLTHLDPVTYQQVQGWLNKPLYAILRGISPSEGEIRHEKLVEEVTQGLLKLRYRRLKDRLQEIQYMMAEFDNGGDAYSAEQHGGNIVLVLNAALAGITRAQARHSLAGKRAAAEAQARMQTQSMD